MPSEQSLHGRPVHLKLMKYKVTDSSLTFEVNRHRNQRQVDYPTHSCLTSRIALTTLTRQLQTVCACGNPTFSPLTPHHPKLTFISHPNLYKVSLPHFVLFLPTRLNAQTSQSIPQNRNKTHPTNHHPNQLTQPSLSLLTPLIHLHNHPPKWTTKQTSSPTNSPKPPPHPVAAVNAAAAEEEQ